MVGEVIRLLEEEQQSFLPDKVTLVVQKYGLEVEDLDGLSKEVMAEGVKRTMGDVEKFFETLKIPAPLEKIEEALWKGGEMEVRFPDPQAKRPHFTVRIYTPTLEPSGKSSESVEELTFPWPWWDDSLYGGLRFFAWPGKVSLTDSYVTYLARERAMVVVPVGVEERDNVLAKISATGSRLRPFLSHIGLDEVDRALSSLSYLEKGEAWVSGPYVLARTDPLDWRDKGKRLMRRGTILGDPELDKAALLENEVSLALPGDVEISFRSTWWLDRVNLHEVRFRLGYKVLELDENSQLGFFAPSLCSDPIGRAIQRGLKAEFESLSNRIWVKKYQNLEEVFLDEVFSRRTSPEMLTFLRAFAEHESPLRALAEGGLAPRTRTDPSLDI
jgi:hypothetical protein